MGYASRLSHGVVGRGLNDYDRIFSTLKSVGFNLVDFHRRWNERNG